MIEKQNENISIVKVCILKYVVVQCYDIWDLF